jgi:hypothetical protein
MTCLGCDGREGCLTSGNAESRSKSVPQLTALGVDDAPASVNAKK